MGQLVRETNLPLEVQRGKVRDVYRFGDELLLVATDRISAFDVVMNEAIPDKGRLLTGITAHYLRSGDARVGRHHLLGTLDGSEDVPESLRDYADQLVGRTLRCKAAEVIPIECVVRGYLAGGGWREYQQSGSVSGVQLPAGLREAERLSTPIFTPSTKAQTGHDEPIHFEVACDQVGRATMEILRDRSLALFSLGQEFAARGGLILADTKFEFGVHAGEIILIDEVLTPDSSRYWLEEAYAVGRSPASLDKEFLRRYLLGLDWDRTPPAPQLPDEIVAQTRSRYVEAYERLTGSRFGAEEPTI